MYNSLVATNALAQSACAALTSTQYFLQLLLITACGFAATNPTKINFYFFLTCFIGREQDYFFLMKPSIMVLSCGSLCNCFRYLKISSISSSCSVSFFSFFSSCNKISLCTDNISRIFTKISITLMLALLSHFLKHSPALIHSAR